MKNITQRSRRVSLVVLCVLVYATIVASFSAPLFATNPKREFRATWLTTVRNVDWPVKGAAAASQQKDLVRMIDSLYTLNMNVVCFQVRCNSDAFYKSAYEPWSDLLTGTRGKDPGYDPLEICLEECHKRGMQCHVWINPYRYNNAAGGGYGWTGKNDIPENYEHTHPEWVLYFPDFAKTSARCAMLDPGIPEVRDRVKEVVGDILEKYDVDGVLFDDYFYPYGGTNFQDSASQRLYRPDNLSVSQWRRENVRQMVQGVYDTIAAVKPWVTFGISPFGIWTNETYVARQHGITLPKGIASSSDMYAEIYCDPITWLEDGSVDYISPQLYWSTTSGQPYGTLCPWWADIANRFGRHFYSSMSTDSYYRSVSGFSLAEMQKETDINRSSSKDGAFGCILFNTLAYVYDKKFRKAFLEEQFKFPALPPAINWKATEEQPMVTDLELNGQTLSWKHENSGRVYYAVYAIPNSFKNRVGIWSIGDALVGVTYKEEYVLPEAVKAEGYTIAVSVLDRYNNEYALRILGDEVEEGTPTTLKTPEADAKVDKWENVTFSWELVKKADSYIVQVARDEEFKEIVMAQEVTATSMAAASRLSLTIEAGNGTYYWRVKTRQPNTGDVWSEGQAFTVGEEEPAGVETVESERGDYGKVLEGGRVYILKDGRKFTVLGQEVR